MKVFTKISTLIFFKKQDLQSSVAMSEESFKSMRQAPTLGRWLRMSKFESQYKNHKVKNCGKNCISCPYLLKASLHQFKLVNKTFFLKNSFNCESSNLILCGHLPRMQRRIYRTNRLSSERANKNLKTTYSCSVNNWQSKNVSLLVDT